MRKLLIPVIALLTMANSADAQRTKKKTNDFKPYARAGLGYGISNGSPTQAPVYLINHRQALPASGTLVNNYPSGNNYSESFDMKKLSYSSGVMATVAFGVMVSKHIGVELAANIGVATRQLETKLTENTPTDRYTITVSQKAVQPVFLTPSIVLQSGGKVNLYSRGGIVIPVISRITQDASFIQDRYNIATSSFVRLNTVNWTEEYKMRLSPGFSGAIGVKYGINKRLSVWGEAGIMSMSLYYKSSELTAYEGQGPGGRVTLSNIAPAQRVSEYEFKGTTTNNTNTYPTTQVPFSNFNISAGISVDL